MEIDKPNTPILSVTLTTGDTFITRYSEKGKPTQSYPVRMSDVAQAVNVFGSSTGILPANTVFVTQIGSFTRIAVWIEPKQYKVTFDMNKRGKTMKLSMPGLLFIGEGRRYSVFASPVRPSAEKARLYVAPLPNVALDGLICNGNVEMPQASTATIMRAFTLFFESRFNNHLSSGKLSGQKGNDTKTLFDLFEQLHSSGKAFPIKRLRSSVTLADVMKTTRKEFDV